MLASFPFSSPATPRFWVLAAVSFLLMCGNSVERQEEHFDCHVRVCLPRPGCLKSPTPVPMNFGFASIVGYCYNGSTTKQLFRTSHLFLARRSRNPPCLLFAPASDNHVVSGISTQKIQSLWTRRTSRMKGSEAVFATHVTQDDPSALLYS